MNIIDPKSEKAEILFYQQFLTEMHLGLNNIRQGLSDKLFQEVADDIQFTAFSLAIIHNNFEIIENKQDNTYSIRDRLGEHANRNRLYTAFNRLCHKLANPQSEISQETSITA